MEKFTTCLWFDNQAEEAANFYVSIFKDSKITAITHYHGKESEEVSGRPEGSILTVSFELNGNQFMALNGGPIFKFSEASSIMIHCEDQKKIDYYWEKLTEGGDPKSQQCGWLKDKYGVSWQIVPAIMPILIQDKDPQKAERVMHAMFPMKKLDIQKLMDAAEAK